MPVLVPSLGLAYFPVPKNACTTLKEAFFELNEGRPFAPSRAPDGRMIHIHNTPGYGTPEATPAGFAKAEGFLRLAVIRDPIRRLVSCWKNRVLFHRELSLKRVPQAAFTEHGLVPDPPFDLFIERLEDYRALAPSIRHHTDLQVVFLGRDPSLFEHVAQLEQLAEVELLVNRLAGRTVVFGHKQRGGREFPDPVIDDATLRRMRDYAAEDFDHWRFA